MDRLQAKRHLDIPDTMRVRDSTMSVSRALQTGHSLQLPMTLADTMGWWAAGVADAMRVDDMLDGTMMSGHPLEQVFRRDPKFTRREPAPVHGAHVIILAVPARTALNDDNLMMVIDMVKKANGLPCYVALTRVDELDTNLRVNPHRLRESADINQCIDAFARATGVPRQHIFPVQLYGENTSVEVGDPRIEVPVLRLLWQAITGATDRLSQLYDNGLALDEDARRGMAEMGACGADNRDVDAGRLLQSLQLPRGRSNGCEHDGATSVGAERADTACAQGPSGPSAGAGCDLDGATAPEPATEPDSPRLRSDVMGRALVEESASGGCGVGLGLDFPPGSPHAPPAAAAAAAVSSHDHPDHHNDGDEDDGEEEWCDTFVHLPEGGQPADSEDEQARLLELCMALGADRGESLSTLSEASVDNGAGANAGHPGRGASPGPGSSVESKSSGSAEAD